jgi:hypothetical protein
VDYLVAGRNTAALATLAVNWRELVALLQDAEFAHGDLQHGNVLVDQEGTLRLVDFDGVWIPQLAGQAPPTEYGHPNYQHPGQHVWGRWLDTFSALVIYLSLVALAKDPGLWLALYNSKNLLFSRPDFSPPFETQTWKQLAALRDPQVDELARRLRECCDPGWVSGKSLELTLSPPQAVIPPPAPRPWWERVQAPPEAATELLAAVPPPAGAELPAPPPLSTPLSTAGTGPMKQLRPAADTNWWTAAPGQAPRPPARRTPRQGYAGAALGAGIVLLIIGAAAGAYVVVILGLALAAGGVYWLVAKS